MKMHVVVWAALVAAGCGKKQDDKPAAKEPPALPAAAPCPDDEALAAQLAGLWQLGKDQKVVPLGCVAGNFPEPGWYVMAFVDSGADPEWPDESELRQDVVAGGKLVTATEPQHLSPPERNEGYSFSELAAVDFDGDGTHEVVFQEDFAYREVSSTDYTVVARRGGKVERLLSVPLERDVDLSAWQLEDEEEGGADPASISCKASVVRDGPKLTFTGTIQRTGDTKTLALHAEGCIDGTRVYLYQSGAFTAQP
jgi:hypothetical protein